MSVAGSGQRGPVPSTCPLDLAADQALLTGFSILLVALLVMWAMHRGGSACFRSAFPVLLSLLGGSSNPLKDPYLAITTLVLAEVSRW